MLSVVEDEDVAARGLGGDDAWVLRHVPGSVDFALVVDLDLDLDFARDRTEPAELALLVVVVWGVELCVLIGQLDGSYQLENRFNEMLLEFNFRNICLSRRRNLLACIFTEKMK